jgi:uncharacterized paraquat-inducible protein A
MATPAPETPKAQMLYCVFCKEDFISYKMTDPAECPRCGRPAQARPQRRYTRLAAVAVVAAVIIVALLAYALSR